MIRWHKEGAGSLMYGESNEDNWISMHLPDQNLFLVARTAIMDSNFQWGWLILNNRLSDPGGCFDVFFRQSRSGSDESELDSFGADVIVIKTDLRGLPLRVHVSFDLDILGSRTLWPHDFAGNSRDSKVGLGSSYLWLSQKASPWKDGIEPEMWFPREDPC